MLQAETPRLSTQWQSILRSFSAFVWTATCGGKHHSTSASKGNLRVKPPGDVAAEEPGATSNGCSTPASII